MNNIIFQTLLETTFLNFNCNIQNCFFQILGNSSINGGAINIYGNNNKIEIFNSYFVKCKANNGGAIYSLSVNMSLILKNCFQNCSCINWGMSIFLSCLTNGKHNISNNNIIDCSSKSSASRSIFALSWGKPFIKNLNISNNNVLTYDVLLSQKSEYLSAFHLNIINNIAEIVLNIDGCVNGFFENCNIINNIKTLNSHGMISNPWATYTNIINCIFIKNNQRSPVTNSNLLSFTNCKFFQNIFSINSPVQLSTSPNLIIIIIENFCYFQKQSTSKKEFNFLFFFEIFIVNNLII